MSRKTKAITYNIKERGRRYNGEDRSNVDVQSMINAINSPAVQELVETGDLYGYYGHEVRMRYGMNPPDTVFTDDGREIYIAPASRTIELFADKQGNVTHRQEFFENKVGEFAHEQYKAKIGGFSSAVRFDERLSRNGSLYVKEFNGFDFCKLVNYHTNKGFGAFDGLMFDSLQNPTNEQLVLKQALEKVLIAQYDSIYQIMDSKQDVQTATQMIDFYQQEALASQQQLMDYMNRQQRLAQKRQNRQEQLLDSLICPSAPFAKFLDEVKAFDSIDLNMVNQNSNKETPQQTTDYSGLSKILGF